MIEIPITYLTEMTAGRKSFIPHQSTAFPPMYHTCLNGEAHHELNTEFSINKRHFEPLVLVSNLTPRIKSRVITDYSICSSLHKSL